MPAKRAALSAQEKLDVRREQTARASRALRERRRDEALNLRQENNRLRAEQALFRETIDKLTKEVGLAADSVDAKQQSLIVAENDLLRGEVHQHTLFLVSLLAETELSMPDPDRVNREIAEQTVDSARLSALRALAVASLRATRVKPVLCDSPDPNVRLVSSATVFDDGAVMMRADVLIRDLPHILRTFGVDNCKMLRDFAVLPWGDSELFRAAYANLHPESTFSYVVVPDFAWEADPLDETKQRIQTSYVAESSAEGNYDWVFLNSTSERRMMQSSLWGGAQLAELVYAHSTSQSIEPDCKRASMDPMDEPRGDVVVYCGHRTVTCHYCALNEDMQRMVDNVTESFYVFEEVVDGATAFRVVQTLLGRANTRMPPFGALFAQIAKDKVINEHLKFFAEHHLREMTEVVMRMANGNVPAAAPAAT